MATNDQSIVIGIFDDSVSANRAVNALLGAGFSNDQIRHTSGEESERSRPSGIKALFSGEKIMPHKDVKDDLVNMGIDPEDARIYQREYEGGHPLVSVTCSGNMQEAIAILTNQGAHAPEELAKRGTESRTSERIGGMPGARASEVRTPGVIPGAERVGGMPGARADEAPVAESTEAQKIRLHAERLRAYKQPEEVGKISVHKEVITEQQILNVPVTREEVVIERHPVAEGASTTEESIGEGETIRIPVREEKVNVTKETVTTGEVEISRREIKENRQFSDRVRREEAQFEKEGDVPIVDRGANRPPDQPQV